MWRWTLETERPRETAVTWVAIAAWRQAVVFYGSLSWYRAAGCSVLSGGALGSAVVAASRTRMCSRIVAMASGFSLRAMTRSLPPRWGQVSMSMAKTRFRRRIQVMGARGLSGFSLRGLRFGATDSRCLQFGANTPWNRVRFNRGRGTKAARRAMTNRQDCRFGRPKVARRVAHMNVRHQLEWVEDDVGGAVHWTHLRTTNVVESVFPTIRHRSSRAKGCVTRRTMLSMIYKMGMSAEKSGARRVPLRPGRGALLQEEHMGARGDGRRRRHPRDQHQNRTTQLGNFTSVLLEIFQSALTVTRLRPRPSLRHSKTMCWIV